MAERQTLDFDKATAALMNGKKPDRATEVVQMTPGQARKWKYDKRRKRAIYDMPEELMEAVTHLADEWDCSRSDAAAWLIVQGIQTVSEGATPEREPSAKGNVRNRWALVLPELPSLR